MDRSPRTHPDSSASYREPLGGLAAALLAGLLGAALGGWLGGLLSQGSADGWGDLIGAVLGMLGGYTLGAPAGVVGLSALRRRPGHPWRALLGSLLGAAAVLLLAEPLGLNRHPAVMLGSFGLVVLTGTLLGFYLGADARAHRREGAR